MEQLYMCGSFGRAFRNEKKKNQHVSASEPAEHEGAPKVSRDILPQCEEGVASPITTVTPIVVGGQVSRYTYISYRDDEGWLLPLLENRFVSDDLTLNHPSSMTTHSLARRERKSVVLPQCTHRQAKVCQYLGGSIL